MQVFDITDINTPFLVGTVTSEGLNIPTELKVINNFAYVVEYGWGDNMNGRGLYLIFISCN